MHQPLSQQGLLQDLFTPTTESPWSIFSNSQELTTFNTQLFPIPQDHDFILQPSPSSLSNSSPFLHFTSSSIQPDHFPSPYTDESIYSSVVPCFDTFGPVNGSVCSAFDQELLPLMVEEEEGENGGDGDQKNGGFDDKVAVTFDVGLIEEKKSRSKKVEGQPSKNLMAERRRRKRLNDRLSMLRSIVPKISKMDRTSILGDTIDYMKELLDKIQDLKEQDLDSDVDHMKLAGTVTELTKYESQIRNSPKFDVERRNADTRIEICCSTKPGLLLSTVNTLEALGLDIQQCVISCFNDFSLQASCSEAREHRTKISCEEMKQMLFRNAGYGGRCL